MNNFDEIYTNILARIIDSGSEELNIRTGHKVKAVPGINISIDLKDGFPLLSLRTLPFSFVPEIMWMLSGSNTNEWLSKHTKIWNYFTETDGSITSAYGYRWRKHFGVDQLETVLNKLKEDSSNRHGVVMMWSPKDDLTTKQKNVPCPYTFHLGIIGGRLHLHLIIRSNDMILGNPTDVAGFALLNHILAQELKVEPGILTVNISNAHIYDNQYEVAEMILSRTFNQKAIEFVLPKDSYQRACKLDNTLIYDIEKGFKNYNPQPAIKNIPIAI